MAASITTADLRELRELTNYEIERGKPMPSKNHAILENRLVRTLGNKYEGKYDILPELSFEFKTGRKTPDVAILPVLEANWLDDEIRMTEPPLGVIEILSPSQSLQEILDKLPDYFEAGVQSCWMVVPPLRMIHVFSAKNQYKTFTDEILADTALSIELDLCLIFR